MEEKERKVIRSDPVPHVAAQRTREGVQRVENGTGEVMPDRVDRTRTAKQTTKPNVLIHAPAGSERIATHTNGAKDLILRSALESRLQDFSLN